MFTLDDFKLRIYDSWIDEHIPKDEIMGNCTIWARVMRETFPELIHVGGYMMKKKREPVQDPFWDDLSADFWNFGSRPHYHEYLRTPEGEVVDPTRIQFPTNFEYMECEEHLVM